MVPLILGNSYLKAKRTSRRQTLFCIRLAPRCQLHCARGRFNRFSKEGLKFVHQSVTHHEVTKVTPEPQIKFCEGSIWDLPLHRPKYIPIYQTLPTANTDVLQTLIPSTYYLIPMTISLCIVFSTAYTTPVPPLTCTAQ